jgi:hypothetical protein
MDSFKNNEVEEILEEEILETEEQTDEATNEADEAIEEATDSASKQKSNVAAAKQMGQGAAVGAASLPKESPKYKGLYKDGTGKGAIIPEPIDTDDVEGDADVASNEKQMKNVDKKRMAKEDVAVHMDAMFNGEELSEEFKTKASTIFETAVNERIEAIAEELETEFETRLLSAQEQIKNELTEQLDSYLSYVIEEWMEENRLAVEKGIRNEVTEQFIEGLRSLFLQHNIEVPASKVDLVDEMAEKVEELTGKLNEEIQKNVEMSKTVGQLRRSDILDEQCDGLADTQKERFKKLAEGVAFESEDDYRSKLEIIRESYFGVGSTETDSEGGEETVAEASDEVGDSIDGDDVAAEPKETISESMSVYAKALSRLNRK